MLWILFRDLGTWYMRCCWRICVEEEKCIESGGQFFVRDGVCLPLRKVRGEVEKARTAVAVKRSLARLLGELFREERLASFVNCARKLLCLDVLPVFDGYVHMVLVKSRLVSGGFCPSFDDYGGTLNVLRA